MLFNSIDFAIFLPIVFAFYWFIFSHNLKAQNLFILIASYVFYGWWDWKFLSLIFLSSLADYLVGIGLENQQNTTKRKLLLSVSVVGNLSLLGFFKYYNFFVSSFADAFSFFGREINPGTLNIILPV
jgi:D-alanyl-lipoteichoic acid acyltransferase DltB (MBOAT superfamily)